MKERHVGENQQNTSQLSERHKLEMAKITSQASLNRRFRKLEARIDERFNHKQVDVEDIKPATQVEHEFEKMTIGELRRMWLDEDLPEVTIKPPVRTGKLTMARAKAAVQRVLARKSEN